MGLPRAPELDGMGHIAFTRCFQGMLVFRLAFLADYHTSIGAQIFCLSLR